jgi:hypothetical protein
VSLRPRFAGDGLLQLPSDVQVVRAAAKDRHRGDVFCALLGERIDPFGREASDLLLAEAFARVDLSRPRKAREWYLAHGAVALGWLFPEDATHPLRFAGLELTSQDTQVEILAQQGLVRWHLRSLVRLTARRSHAEEGWDSSWSSVLLEGPDDQEVWVGAPLDVDVHRSPTIEPETPWSLPPGLPRLPVPQEAWSRYWVGYDLPGPDEDGRHARLGTDHHGLLELQRRLIEPYLRSALPTEVRVEPLSAHKRAEGGAGGEGSGELVVRETRIWGSILAPIYLQLLEGLRRVSEGKPGATWCRECGEPFLTLDARRSTFCTDRERVRYAQRRRPRAPDRRLVERASLEG